MYNIGLYIYIQNILKGRDRFQKINNNNTVIGDIEGIKLFIKIVHGKLRTPKNS
jgi:hypothetical protein